MITNRKRRFPPWTLVVALLFPSLLTYAYFVALVNQPAALSQWTYGIGKLLQFSFPAIVVLGLTRQRFRWARPDRRGLAAGAAFGLAVVGAMGALYFAWLRHSSLIDRLAAIAIERTQGMGVNALWKYVALALFYAFFHSLLEEYYWRWFVYRGLKTLAATPTANLISSVGFMAHHVILLGTYFGWSSPLTYLFSAGVAIGGSFWAALYEEHQSLYGPWLSHLLVDAGIFWIGYDLVSQSW